MPPWSSLKNKTIFIEVELIYSIVLVSGVYQNKSVIYTHIFVLFVQSLSHVQLFATPWTAEHQASLSFTVSQSLLKLMSIESVMPSNHLFTSGGQSIGPSASASVLLTNIQCWFPSGSTGLVSLQSKGLSRVFSRFFSHVSHDRVLSRAPWAFNFREWRFVFWWGAWKSALVLHPVGRRSGYSEACTRAVQHF